MIIKINNEAIEEYYCEVHKEWNQYGDEMNCCARQLEEEMEYEY